MRQEVMKLLKLICEYMKAEYSQCVSEGLVVWACVINYEGVPTVCECSRARITSNLTVLCTVSACICIRIARSHNGLQEPQMQVTLYLKHIC